MTNRDVLVEKCELHMTDNETIRTDGEYRLLDTTYVLPKNIEGVDYQMLR